MSFNVNFRRKISQVNVPPDYSVIVIVDGFFVLHLIREFTKNFESISI